MDSLYNGKECIIYEECKLNNETKKERPTITGVGEEERN